MELQEKLDRLLSVLQSYDTIAVAYSGGVDSTFLLACAVMACDDRVTAIRMEGSNFPEAEKENAGRFCLENDIREIVIHVNPLDIPGFAQNPKDRCYHCKSALFTGMQELCQKESLGVLCEGTNADDLSDYRPGMKAIAELDVKSPLQQAGLTKQEIRSLSRQFGLPTADVPSGACLASRIPYGETITEQKLKTIELAEIFLHELGFVQTRVRLYDNIARIEVAAQEIEKLAAQPVRCAVVEYFKKLGIRYITLDLEGFRSGSMNEVLV